MVNIGIEHFKSNASDTMVEYFASYCDVMLKDYHVNYLPNGATEIVILDYPCHTFSLVSIAHYVDTLTKSDYVFLPVKIVSEVLEKGDVSCLRREHRRNILTRQPKIEIANFTNVERISSKNSTILARIEGTGVSYNIAETGEILSCDQGYDGESLVERFIIAGNMYRYIFRYYPREVVEDIMSLDDSIDSHRILQYYVRMQ